MTAALVAENLLRAANVAKPEDIDLEAIAWTQNAVVKYCPLNGCDAQIRGTQNRAVIRVAETAPPARRRFSVGHELGHWMLHRGENFQCSTLNDDQSKRAEEREREADRFASELIFPRYLFDPALEAISKLSGDAILNLAENFQSSLYSTLLKIIEVTDSDLILVRFVGSVRRSFHFSESCKRTYSLLPTSPKPQKQSYTRHKGWGKPRTSLNATSAWFGLHPHSVQFLTHTTFFCYGGETLVLISPFIF